MIGRLTPLAVACLALACGDGPAPRADLVLRGASVIDVVGGSTSPDQDIFITGERVTAIRPSGGGLPSDAQVVDVSGQFVIPGLWDMHVHSAANTSWHFPVLLAHGITGVRNMHSTVDDALGLTDSIRTAVASGRTLGPRFVANGPIVDGDPSPWDGAVVVRTEAETRAAVDSLARGGAEFIKV